MKIINPKFQALNIHFNLFDRPWNICHLFWDTLYYLVSTIRIPNNSNYSLQLCFVSSLPTALAMGFKLFFFLQADFKLTNNIKYHITQNFIQYFIYLMSLSLNKYFHLSIKHFSFSNGWKGEKENGIMKIFCYKIYCLLVLCLSDSLQLMIFTKRRIASIDLV